MPRRKNPELHDIEVEIDGKHYEGTYSVESGVVTVYYGFNNKATQIGGSSAQRIARTLLFELIAEAEEEERRSRGR